ncbi:uncharacterized isomerase BH0283 isoform X2 [Triticum aestivum]|uniref:uncharacterized isomerase BH0283 isoform X2 n=1 Tax=Triticum aestivum TaxID=4565 RepID=UPI001D00CD37|nr:uncharacterized isomerase BH0283-like isoform X2 [Triticum aestivum]
MCKKAIRYAVVDAFATEPFKGNPAAVCLLDDDNAADERWMQSVATEFNLSETAFLVRDLSRPASAAPLFHLRWFTPVTEVELSSAKEVADILPNIEEIKKLSCGGIMVTGPAPAGSGYNFFTRLFCPKFGMDEDPVTGSIHCVLGPFWGRKLGKQKLTAFQASPRGGTLYLELDDANRRVKIQGETVTVMSGTLLV